ncbi:MAG: DEAD/DEAH box helicase family protein [Desulfobacterales bacterium]|nr:DEAD/DEAH box helicase family protein [Desulfobacterales bacterium]MDZ4341692.1 DEAD/DEAH box helicase family protein [Candidatus Binatia bacterium]
MEYRKQQAEFQGVIDGIVNRKSPVKNIVVNCTPGGGKSLLPLQAGKLIIAGLADRLAWIVPRLSLQDQGERNFLDQPSREMLGYSLVIRTACNEANCSRGTNGIITTYQALAADSQKTVLRDFQRYRYILIADEFHHLEVDGEWTAPMAELYQAAAFRVMMTGTLARGDCKKIAFTNYVKQGDDLVACPIEDKENAFISYNRRDALEDKAIIPLEFHFADGLAKWRKESGKEITAKLSTSRADANQALYTALNTEYAEELLLSGVDHWQQHRKSVNPNSSLLIVAASIENAKEYTAILRRKGLKAEIATSDDTPQAVKHIKALKAGTLKILCAVAMIYEGADFPSATHIIILTNIRSLPWMEQCVARAVRIDPQAGPYETQKGYIFAPADRMFTELAAKIEADQCEAVAKAAKEKSPVFTQAELFGEGSSRPGITPLSSRMLDAKRQHIFHYSDTSAPIQTQRELEQDLRKQIDRHVKGFCRTYNVKPAHLNHTLKDRFGKPRDMMTVPELERLQTFLRDGYSVKGGRV